LGLTIKAREAKVRKNVATKNENKVKMGIGVERPIGEKAATKIKR